ncbi:paREP15 coiled-coil protein [Rhizophagus irregularis DAOM 181602=DAOM 197198]|nr:paREP15 coiled-coil protein [Rhizophagus irregularis DAOM 181602=DAOM 197198]
MAQLEDPEILQSPYFKIQSTLEPESLAETSIKLLNAIKSEPKLTESYCLEVRFEEDKAFFVACLNPVLWFDVYLRGKPLEEATKIARTFVTNTRLAVPVEKIAPFEVEHNKTVNDLAFTQCKFGRNCRDRKQGNCSRDHLDAMCKGTTKTRDGRDTVCSYYVIGNLIVWERTKYYILFRREPIRGLLMIPRPNDDTKNNFNHFDNTSIIKNKQFWQDLLEERGRLGFNMVSLNYGTWETGQAKAKDKYAQNCHAHVHLNFDDTEWEKVKTMAPENIKPLLDSRDSLEPSNLLKNCHELESYRLQIVEAQSMVNSSVILSNKIDAFSKKMDTVVTSFSETNNKMDTVVASFSETNNKMDTVVASFSETNKKIDAFSKKMDIVATNFSETSKKIDTVVTSLSETNIKLSELIEILLSKERQNDEKRN